MTFIRSIQLLSCLIILAYACAEKVTNKYEEAVIRIDPVTAEAEAVRIRKEVSVDVADDLDLSLWAADSLVQDPIAISVAPDGRIFYTRANRQRSSEFDIRGHSNWMTASLSFKTPEDRRKFLRETFSVGSDESEAHLKDLNEDGILDWKDLTVEKENVWFVTDESGDGVADHTRRYLIDFNEEITDVANGIEYYDGEVYIAVGPDLWRAGDDNADGTADRVESLSRGYGVHVGFSGHGMSGVTVGPQGRIWWGIGDIGMNVVDKDGKEHKNPNRGVVVRCDPDGSNFEVFAYGVRNTHEFAWDDYGNLITVDNDGDHAGESERLVYLIDGSDSGWRINWQFGKYTDPKNNTYKVWMDEEMYKPRHEGQAAYFLPPIQNFVNGPTGLVYNPGTALSPDYYGHFFVAEFRGSPNNSPLHAFKMKADGAGFALADSRKIVEGLLPTGMDFGADGSLYVADWINGWGLKDEGRIWRLTAGAGAERSVQEEVKELLNATFRGLTLERMRELLGHQDQRVRRKAQFELVKRKKGYDALMETAKDRRVDRLARIHALWGIAQTIRQKGGEASDLEPYLLDADEEIIAQSARLLGDLNYAGANETLIGLLGHPSPRVRFFAVEALGHASAREATQPIMAMLREDDGRDTWLRHGSMIALARIGDAAQLSALTDDPSRTIRTVAVVALRRLEAPEVAKFLADEDEYVVAEAARAINDDYTIPEALPALAAVLDREGLSSEPLLRRAINANLTVGGKDNVAALVAYAQRTEAPASLRAEALSALAHWAEPSVFDRVDGRHRGERTNDATYVTEKLGGVIAGLVSVGDKEVRIAAIRAVSNLQLTEVGDQLTDIVRTDGDPDLRAEAVVALDRLKVPGLEDLLRLAMNDRSSIVRQRALEMLPSSTIEPAAAVELYREVIQSGPNGEAQSAIAGLGKINQPEARTLTLELIGQMAAGGLPTPVHLDLIDVAEAYGDPEIDEALAAYEEELLKTDELGLLASALEGGDPRSGRGVFYWNSTAQCTRCHAIFEYGGNVGPNLAGVARRLQPRELLTSVVRPSANLAPGHETVLVTLTGDEMISGIVLERTPENLTLKVGKTETKTIPRSDILEVETLPSSMPTVEGKISRREIRDLVAFLGTLEGEDDPL